VTDTDRLFTEHRQGVFRFLCRLVGQTEPARDLTQEVFLRVARSGVPPTDADGQRAWVYRVARNLGLNFLRDSGRRPTDSLAAEPMKGPQQELAFALSQALRQLADLDRDVFLLREEGGLSYDEIAAACDLTPTAVRSRLFRARLQLRSALAPNLGRAI
jgi:RNA polymerase sigma-70 factor (ECF subfamily)